MAYREKMSSRVPEKLFVKLGDEFWRSYGIDKDRSGGHYSLDNSWQKRITIDLSALSKQRLTRLISSLEKFRSEIKGTGVLINDAKAWIRVIDEDGDVKARSVEQFTVILKEYLRRVPGHRLYKIPKTPGGPHLPYYVDSVEYVPERDHGRDRTPPQTNVRLLYCELGVNHATYVSFSSSDCIGRTPTEALRAEGYLPETDELRKAYLFDETRWRRLYTQVGLQVLGRGLATDNLDGNPDGGGWSRYSFDTILLDHTNEPARLVIDVFRETDKEDRNNKVDADIWFWGRTAIKIESDHATSGEDDGASYDQEMDDDDDDGEKNGDDRQYDENGDPIRPEVEIPIHCVLACFDLRRHLRLRVHVRGVTPYEYDVNLADKLVLPEDLTTIVKMLIHSNAVFKDIIEGKSGGTTVLCAGAPGVGKTLTAEVYSEASQRPLYSVQCSQLGTDPDSLEGELFKIFARSKRWNAILLLDEADVYVMERGSDLQQNAIVGVFLRTLEYYSGTMFMTTNRAESVDDAIASRCVARLVYGLPSRDQQRKLWRILSDVAGANISDDTISDIITRDDWDFSGRDIKNLIKLATLVNASTKEPITTKTISFVMQFRPTLSKSTEARPGRLSSSS